MELVLIIIIFFLVFLNIYTYYKLNEKINTANRIRIGYEKKCNSFRIKYTLLSGLEKSETVLRKVRETNKPVYIYGGGVIGKKLFGILCEEDQIEVLGVIESNELKLNPEMARSIRKDAQIIVTPMFDFENIINLLKSREVPVDNVAGLDEYL